MKGKPTRAVAMRALAALATGRANDCARLALEEHPPVEELDLTLLQEIRRNANGSVEVRLADRLKTLELLITLLDQDQSAGEAFFRELSRAAGSTSEGGEP